MAEIESNKQKGSSHKFQKLFYIAQIGLRIGTLATSLAAAILTVTNIGTIELIPGFPIVAKYSYEGSFTYLAAANFIAAAFSLLSLIAVAVLGRPGSNPTNYFYFFIGDLLTLSLELSAIGAATAIGLLAKNGNNRIGWPAICGFATKFCNRGMISIVFAYFAMVKLVMLTIISATKSR
ncbi:hypothetical protein K2173_005450 [Erythroxylum novogranatense]|uniref:CASP-like protein n=1 Tax=Erythroxylum novogranatense TaxID=1862640 RepID=A0AAV8SJW7_9ROSI|nr:hypothetical protein K2173_005450 [Erythroxylum novogranatense]